jgi:hypothetical protein
MLSYFVSPLLLDTFDIFVYLLKLYRNGYVDFWDWWRLAVPNH